MKKGEIYEGIIEKVDFPNKGYVMVEDQKVLVKNGMPGQKIRFVIQKKTFRKSSGPYSGGTGKITSGKKRACMFFISPVSEAACTRQCHMKSSFI